MGLTERAGVRVVVQAEFPCYIDPCLERRQGMANLTVVIESDTLKRARMRALAEGTSTSD